MAEAKTVKKARVTKPKAEVKEVAPKAAPKAHKKPVALSKNDFAVIVTGGKQYRVHVGQKIKIEKILGDHKEGDTLVFKEVLLKNEGDKLTLGTPKLATTVTSTITSISRYKTVDVIHYKQKSRYFKKYGHRQPYFEVQIDSIK